MTRNDAIYLAQGGRCLLCQEPMERRQGGSRGWTRDHIIPQSRGGKDHYNIIFSHAQCNAKRGNGSLTKFQLQIALGVILETCRLFCQCYAGPRKTSARKSWRKRFKHKYVK